MLNPITRRAFAGAASLAALAAAPRYRVRLVSNTYIWVQRIQKTGKPAADVWAEAYPAIRRAGYSRVELISDCLRPPLRDLTCRLLKENSLHLNEIYNGGNMHDPEAARKTIADTLEIARAARSVGTEILLFDLGPKRDGARKTDDELATVARSLNELGKQARSLGMRLYLHNHDNPMRDGAREWRYALHNTDPALMSFCVDPDWMWNGGEEPMALVREAGTRIKMVHVRTQRQKVWTEALEDGGDINWRDMAAFLRSISFDGFAVVELAHRPATKVTRTVEENIRVSREWAEKVFDVHPKDA